MHDLAEIEANLHEFRLKSIGALFEQIYARLTWPVDRPGAILIEADTPGIGIEHMILSVTKLLHAETIVINSAAVDEVNFIASMNDNSEPASVIMVHWDGPADQVAGFMPALLAQRTPGQCIIVKVINPDQKHSIADTALKGAIPTADWYGLTRMRFAAPVMPQRAPRQRQEEPVAA